MSRMPPMSKPIPDMYYDRSTGRFVPYPDRRPLWRRAPVTRKQAVHELWRRWRFPLAVYRDARHPHDPLPFVVRQRAKHITLARAATLPMAIAAARAYIQDNTP